MDREERLHRIRKLHRCRKAEETPQEREVRLVRRRERSHGIKLPCRSTAISISFELHIQFLTKMLSLVFHNVIELTGYYNVLMLIIATCFSLNDDDT